MASYWRNPSSEFRNWFEKMFFIPSTFSQAFATTSDGIAAATVISAAKGCKQHLSQL